MTELISGYNPAAYNKLRELETVDKLVSQKDIETLKPILVKYGHQYRLVIIKSHRHHELAPDEVLVEFGADDDMQKSGIVSVTKPLLIKEMERLNGNIVANTFALFNGKWCPINYEFVDGNALDISPFDDEPFMNEMRDFLMKNNLADTLMLGLQRLDKGEQPMHLVEFNDKVNRTSTMRMAGTFDNGGMLKNDPIETSYGFAPHKNVNGIVSDELECKMQCFWHCNYC